MTKYFIESPDGQWLTDPERWFEGEPGLTNNPFKAWWFDEAIPRTMYEAFEMRERKLWWGIETTTADNIRSTLNEECLTGYKVSKQEFIEHPVWGLTHQTIFPNGGIVETNDKSGIRYHLGKSNILKR